MHCSTHPTRVSEAIFKSPNDTCVNFINRSDEKMKGKVVWGNHQIKIYTSKTKLLIPIYLYKHIKYIDNYITLLITLKPYCYLFVIFHVNT